MPSSWSPKRERQYEHIKSSARARGRSSKRAKEIAAATVNKQRRKAGEAVAGGNRRTKARHVKRKSRVRPPSRMSAAQRGNARTRRRKAARR